MRRREPEPRRSAAERQDPTAGLTKEQRFLLEIARAHAHGRPLSDAYPGIDHVRLLEVANQHRFLAFTSDAVLGLAVTHGMRERRLDKLFSDARGVARYRAREKRATADRLIEALRRRGCPAIVRKGAFLDGQLYGGRGLREFNDIDLFVPPLKRDVARDVADREGFESGWFDTSSRTFHPTTRRERIYYMMNADHLPPMQRVDLSDDILPSIKLDVCFDLAWARHGARDVFAPILEAAFGGPQDGGATGQRDLAFHMLDAVMHVYREAMFEQTLGSNGTNGVRLPKFLDIALLARALSPNDTARLVKWCDRAPDVERTLAWVLHHTDVVLGTDLTAGLGLTIDAEHARTWIARNDRPRRWAGTMVERLFASDPRTVFGPAFDRPEGRPV